MKIVLSLVLILLCSACTPTVLGRTARVLEEDELAVSLAAAYPVSLTERPNCSFALDTFCSFEWVGPAYFPFGSNVDASIFFGIDGRTELITTLAFGIIPGIRLGGKTLLFNDDLSEFSFAVDYGASLFVSNGNLDAGVIASIQIEDVEPYLALRSFGTVYWDSFPASLTFAGTIGASFAQEQDAAFLELTVGTREYNGIDSLTNIQTTGWYISPALGFRFQ